NDPLRLSHLPMLIISSAAPRTTPIMIRMVHKTATVASHRESGLAASNQEASMDASAVRRGEPAPVSLGAEGFRSCSIIAPDPGGGLDSACPGRFVSAPTLHKGPTIVLPVLDSTVRLRFKIMTRIFTSLALVNALIMLAAYGVGILFKLEEA